MSYSLDIVEYYPSIRQEQLRNAINFAKNYSDVSDSDMDIIWHACDTALNFDKRVWKKKNEAGLFDVPMGSFHGAEICDLVGLYILNKLSSLFPTGMYGLYRDDGLSIIDWLPAVELERLRKKTISTMKDIGFRITIEVGQTKTDFLDVSLDLFNNIYSPFRKPNASTSYIHKDSNHPRSIKRSLPNMISYRINALSKNETIFLNSKIEYETALKNGGHDSKLNYEENNALHKSNQSLRNNKAKRSRKRKCIFYNPPHCMSVKTNIGGSFLKLIDKHFKPDNEYRKLFNRSTVKISYCCMVNMKGIIQAHNRKVMRAETTGEEKIPKCNCRDKTACPVMNECLTRNLIYKAEIHSKKGTRSYVGSTGRTFKDRWSGHKSSFKNKERSNTALSDYIWELKEQNTTYRINWKILRKIHSSHDKIGKVCMTCNLERWEIAMADKRKTLNKRSELTVQCPHFRSLYFPSIEKRLNN